MRLGDMTLTMLKDLCVSHKDCEYCPLNGVICRTDGFGLPVHFNENNQLDIEIEEEENK